MDPYEVLGVSADASMDEIEARYRLLLREFHPDVHHANGEAAVARAEEMTRSINRAMDRIRRGYRPPAGSVHARPGAGGTVDPLGTDQAGGSTAPVPCPFCGTPFDRLGDYELHLQLVHRFRTAPPAARPARAPGVLDALGPLRFVPGWLVVLLSFILWLVGGFWWFVGCMALLALVLWAQTTPRFKQDR